MFEKKPAEMRAFLWGSFGPVVSELVCLVAVCIFKFFLFGRGLIFGMYINTPVNFDS